jgi:Xaa-Pro aminopeptidase
MHQAVAKAKNAAIAKMQPGATAESIHQAATDELVRAGFRVARGQVTDDPTVQHGTGHGIGLEIHEPILLDHGGGAMLSEEVFTVEPGLYGRRDGGVRIEDMVVVTRDGPVNLNHLPDGLDWKV